ncbi:MAG: Spy/CpxP family protein refolding chaperone [Gracilimonas sp.]|uniref:Spy/CpxP family protein refolding chaperone n=1 Tax=Gracilimonas TaxID=649462 RepID=UPI001B0D457C|nr:Spy/CpxP family protein refolding chaperone [Gracilimonas sp.]MBO6587303.1 Spy/CpxP family protein refolding chaperone [Gracilimonas sp.]MBO6614209.1 Spy/CpxP family protein refolding chaperone [Gracilimonas sp.]
MKTLVKSFAITALLLSLSVSAIGQQRFKNPDRDRGERVERFQQKRNAQGQQHQRVMAMLDLSDEQKEQIQGIHLNGQKEMLPLKTQLQEAHAKLRTLTVANEYDETEVQEVISEISDLNKTMLTNRVEHRQQIRELLTDDQRVKFDNLHLRMQKRFSRMGANR